MPTPTDRPFLSVVVPVLNEAATLGAQLTALQELRGRGAELLLVDGAIAWGDDAYGLWIDVELAGVVQRFRWIDPGEFVMGSPDDEAERHDDEGPRHRVRLTRGFWLADTACTQALWLAVMGGENPSEGLCSRLATARR